MELSFRVRLLLELVVIGAGLMSAIVLCPLLAIVFAVVIAGIGIILSVDTLRTHSMERSDFKEKITDKALAILGRIAWDINLLEISYPIWSDKSTDLKRELLGEEDYRLWSRFYDSLEARNKRLGLGRFYPLWPEFTALNQSCFDNFLQVYKEASWVRERVPQAWIDDVRSKIKRNTALPPGYDPFT